MVLKKMLVPLFLLLAVSLSAEVLNVHLSSGPVKFEKGTPIVEGFHKIQIPGTPILPATSKLIALPPGSEISSIKISYGISSILESKDIQVSPPFLPLCQDVELMERSIERYERNRAKIEVGGETFPNEPLFCSKMSHFRNIPFVRIIYYPLLYSNGVLRFYPNASVTISYMRKQEGNRITDWVERRASQIFSNWDEMRSYYSITAGRDSFNYVIIAYDNDFSAFDSLMLWKNSIGFSTRIVSIDTIYAQYPGSDNADRIRNFLIDKYLSWGIQYVLLGGNVDAIPMKICFPDSEHNFYTPTDYYFAELTDDWDSDGDGFYGEYDQDSIGFVPEVLVGRFAYNDYDTLESICRKTVNYEMDTGTWKTNALLVAAFSNFENEDGLGWPDCDGAVLMEALKDSILSGWQYTRMYEEAGLCPSIYPHEFPISQANVVAEWSSGSYAIHSWSGHGGPNGAYRKWWAFDDGDSIPEDFEMDWEPFIYITDPPSLDDTHPSITFSSSCSNAEGVDNLARSLIGNGASAIIAATTYGWYTPGWASPADGNIMSINYYFYKYLIAQSELVGDALFDAKVYYFNYLYFPDPWAGDPEWSCQQNMLDYVLFGDPSLRREGVGVEEIQQPVRTLPRFVIFPNPVRSRASIEFSLPYSGKVDISLYDISGRKVFSLYGGRKEAGFHTIAMENNLLSNGVYFLKITLDTGVMKITEKEKFSVVR
jgi:hypothetical protein